MPVTYTSQTKVNKKAVRHSQESTPSATDRLDVIFADADEKMRGCRF